ncbi:MAG: hypothetical protein FJX23_02960 [Alphaproteobacteria bacterium]|nr:hypothetical protein [Alphaproteobacteria bacterium]
MTNTRSIQSIVNDIVEPFHRNTSLADVKTMLRDAQTAVSEFYAKELGAEKHGGDLPKAAAANTAAVHRATESAFGFKVHEQPNYSQFDDIAWEFSQRYTTLEGVTLPKDAEFFTSKREPVSREAMEKKMASGEFHLFDIALSNEYVLLGRNEKFSVDDLENRFSTNNEHTTPQSKARAKCYRADPRVLIISYSGTNSDRGHLQVVFLDDNNKPKESIALVQEPGSEKAELTRQTFHKNGSSRRYPITPEDAPYYAHAIALAHYANGFSDEAKQNWLDRPQAEEIQKMLNKLAEKPVDALKEPVIRDVIGDAKALKGNINPVAVLPDAFAAALETEIKQGKFRGGSSRESNVLSFASRVQAQKQLAASKEYGNARG